MFTIACKHFNVVIAWRLTARPRIIAWSVTNPFSALSAFLACVFIFDGQAKQKTLFQYMGLCLIVFIANDKKT